MSSYGGVLEPRDNKKCVLLNESKLEDGLLARPLGQRFLCHIGENGFTFSGGGGGGGGDLLNNVNVTVISAEAQVK